MHAEFPLNIFYTTWWSTNKQKQTDVNNICRTSSLKEIGADAEQALAELCSCWEEENLSTDEKCKNMNDIRQELLV